MRLTVSVLLLAAACGTDVRPSQSSDPGVDSGIAVDGGEATTASDDARVPPPDDGQPAQRTPCEEAVDHSDYAFIEQNVFAVSCATGGCHTGASPSASLDLTAGRAYGNLVNVASTRYSGWTRVVPGDSASSMLMVQVGGEPGPELEGYMPWGQPRLCDALVDAMRRWIVAGATQ